MSETDREESQRKALTDIEQLAETLIDPAERSLIVTAVQRIRDWREMRLRRRVTGA